MRGPSSRRPVSDCWRQRSIVTARSGRHGSPPLDVGSSSPSMGGGSSSHSSPAASASSCSSTRRRTCTARGLARYYAALLAFMGSILGVALASDLVFIFLFWELTSLCSFVLIGPYTDDSESRYSARMAMVVTVGGGLCLLAGLLMLAVAARGRPRRRDLRSDGDDRERRGDARLPPRVGAVRAGTGPDRRRCGQIRTGAAPLLAAERHGRPRRPSPRFLHPRDDGQGGRLLPRPRASPPDESRMGVGRRDPGAPDDDRRGRCWRWPRPTPRSYSPTRRRATSG